jgi:hypothetical protein
LREALAGGDRADLAEQQAAKLRADNPGRAGLVAELRRNGFLSKGSKAKPGKKAAERR